MGLLELVQGLVAPEPPPGPTQRAGALVMPLQTADTGELAAANTSYTAPFSPGFEEGPEWPIESWLLSSFQVTLSGKLVVGTALELTPETEKLPVVLALMQAGRPVWSQNLQLQLVPELGTDKQHFNFQTGVFVDLTNPLRYDAGNQPYFVVSGLVPVYKPPGPTFESEALERLGSMVELLEAQGHTSEEIATAIEEQGNTQSEIVGELEAAGVSQSEMVELLEQIATNTEGE